MQYITLNTGDIRSEGDEYSKDGGKTWRPVLTFLGTAINQYELQRVAFRRPVSDPLAD